MSDYKHGNTTGEVTFSTVAQSGRGWTEGCRTDINPFAGIIISRIVETINLRVARQGSKALTHVHCYVERAEIAFMKKKKKARAALIVRE